MPYKDPQKHREVFNKMVKGRKEKWMKENGPCKSCGTWENLEVDHIDPKQKSFHINWAKRLEVLLIELLKCQPLCTECHKTKSRAYKGIPLYEGKVDGDFQHGTRWGYEKFKCRCDECKTESNKQARARKKAGKYSTKRHYTDKFATANQDNNYRLEQPIPEKKWEYQHGRETAYRKHGCRCAECVQWYQGLLKRRHDEYKARRAAVNA